MASDTAPRVLATPTDPHITALMRSLIGLGREVSQAAPRNRSRACGDPLKVVASTPDSTFPNIEKPMTDEQPPPSEGFKDASDDDLRRVYADQDGGPSRAAGAELNRRQEARRKRSDRLLIGMTFVILLLTVVLVIWQAFGT